MIIKLSCQLLLKLYSCWPWVNFDIFDEILQLQFCFEIKLFSPIRPSNSTFFYRSRVTLIIRLDIYRGEGWGVK